MTEWSDILKTVLGASVGSALLTGCFTLWRDRWKRKQDATHLAIRLVVILETFSSDCANLIFSNYNAVHFPEEELPHWFHRLPTLGAFPEDGEGWKALNPNDVSECLNMPSRIAGSQFIISEVAEHQEMDVERAVRRQAWMRGIEALELAHRLRLAHGLQPIVPIFDYVNALKDARAESEREDKERSVIELD